MSIHKVLCVDDEEQVLRGLERSLRKNFPVSTAVGGAAALALIQKDRDFTIIISDMRMPDMNGAQFLEQARLLLPTASRVLLTGEADLGAVVTAVNAGHIHHYLRKPVEREALINLLERCTVEHDEAMRLAQSGTNAVKVSSRYMLEAIRHFAPDVTAHAERTGVLAISVAEQLGLSAIDKVELVAWLSIIGRRVHPETAADLEAQLFSDAASRGIFDALRELRAGTRSGVMAHVVHGATLFDELSDTKPEQANEILAREVDERVLHALRVVTAELTARAA